VLAESLALTAALFIIGVIGVLIHRNAIIIFNVRRADADRGKPDLRGVFNVSTVLRPGVRSVSS